MNVFGHYLLFSPIIALLAWIPLVGSLLGMIAAIAAAIFAFIWGSTLHIFILAVSWIIYRPLYGLSLLACVVIICYLITMGTAEETSGASVWETLSE